LNKGRQRALRFCYTKIVTKFRFFSFRFLVILAELSCFALGLSCWITFSWNDLYSFIHLDLATLHTAQHERKHLFIYLDNLKPTN